MKRLLIVAALALSTLVLIPHQAGALTRVQPTATITVGSNGTVVSSSVGGITTLPTGDADTTTTAYTLGTTLTDPTSPTADLYKFVLPLGYHLLPDPNGTGAIAVTNATKAGVALTTANTLLWVSPPAATDRNHQSVPTSYSYTLNLKGFVVGDKITQNTTTSSTTAYPVTVDPQISFGWYIYVHWTHNDIGTILFNAWIGLANGGVIAELGVLLGAVCALLPPGLDIVCAAGVIAATAWYINQFWYAWDTNQGWTWKFAYWGAPSGNYFAQP